LRDSRGVSRRQERARTTVASAAFSPERIQEWVRTGVALSIVAAVIVETLILTIAFVTGGIAASALSAATAAIVTPLVGIAGTVLGFYFGSHRRGQSAEG